MSKGAVLISGAAGGIGTATVDRFLAAGCEVAGVDLSESVVSLRAGAYRGRVADVRDAEQLMSAVDELLEGMELRHVVALAGRVVPEEHELLQREPLEAVGGFASSVALNLTGQFALLEAAIGPLRRSRGDRSITLCSSINALGAFGAPGYSAAKAGLIGMMHGLAAPLGRAGIRINVVAPGTTRTPLIEEESARDGDGDRLERTANEIPIGRVAEPDDVAALIEALALRLTHITGEVIRVDGGQLLARP